MENLCAIDDEVLKHSICEMIDFHLSYDSHVDNFINYGSDNNQF